MSLNKVMLIGNVGSIDIVDTANGKRCVKISLATSESWKDKATGLKKEKTEWHRIVSFDEYKIDYCEQYVTKGALLYVEGAVETSSWTDASGVQKYSTNILVSGFKGELKILRKREDKDSSGEAQTFSRPTPQKKLATAMATPEFVAPDDDIPF